MPDINKQSNQTQMLMQAIHHYVLMTRAYANWKSEEKNNNQDLKELKIKNRYIRIRNTCIPSHETMAEILFYVKGYD